MATERVWPDVAIPPGDVLVEELQARGLTQSRLARRRSAPRRQRGTSTSDPRFLKRVAAARRVLQAGKGIRLEELPR